MILIIDMNSTKWGYEEFVKPLVDITKGEVVHFTNVNNLDKYDRIILSGCALRDNNYLNYNFNWLKKYNGKVLGICAGMQIIGLVFGAKLKKCREIGMTKIKNFDNRLFNKEFMAYCLHNYGLKKLDNFDVIFKSDRCVEGVKLKNKEVYGLLFHPEVRNSYIIDNFLRI